MTHYSVVNDKSKLETVTLEGNNASVTAGGGGIAGSVTILDGSGKSRVQIDGNAGLLSLSDGAALSPTVEVSGPGGQGGIINR